MSLLPLNPSPLLCLHPDVQADSTLGKTGDVAPVFLRHGAVDGHLLVGQSEEPIAVVFVKPCGGP